MTVTQESAAFATNFDLTEEQTILRETVRRFADEVVAPGATKADEESQLNEEAWKGICELGLAGLPFPEEYGGAGMDTLSYIIAVEEIARVCASTSLTYAAHVSLGTYPIFAWGAEELKQKYMPGLCSGEYMGAYGLTEPNAGSDSGATQTTAVRDGDDFILNGRKCFITNGYFAKPFICTAQTDKSKGVKGIVAIVVDKDFPGFSVEPGEIKLGMRGSPWNNLVFQDCRVPASYVLGPSGGGLLHLHEDTGGGEDFHWLAGAGNRPGRL